MSSLELKNRGREINLLAFIIYLELYLNYTKPRSRAILKNALLCNINIAIQLSMMHPKHKIAQH